MSTADPSIGEMISKGAGTLILAPTATATISASVLLVSQVVLPANTARKGFIIYNNSANSVYLTYGPVSTGSTCTRILATFTQYESLGPVVYTGQISAIRNAGAGTLVITELT